MNTKYYAREITADLQSIAKGAISGGSTQRINPLESGVLALNDKQFEHFYECMTNPTEPTQAMADANAQIQALARSRR